MNRHGYALRVWGDRACFTRPEFRAERVSYDVITPSAAAGIFDSIHWKPAIRWVVDRIHVLKPIRWEQVARNEIGTFAKSYKKAHREGIPALAVFDAAENRMQRRCRHLRDVEYIIEAHFEMTDKAGASDNPAKHADIFSRRARAGACFKQPCFGLREFVANFELLDELPAIEGATQDLGWMLHSIDHQSAGKEPRFFRAEMENGTIRVPGVGELYA